ncbi:MAG: phosphotransferase [Ktedonobacterales bacterium]|nr:phosphotransferase [Ktedonobacterales bacterium]
MHSLPDLEADVGGTQEKIERLSQSIRLHLPDSPKRLVHGDYYLANVLFHEDLTVAAVLDFSPHTLIGDPRLDVAGAITFLTLDAGIKSAHIYDLTALAAAKYGEDIHTFIAIYALYYSFYFSDTKEFDPSTYAWCIANLRDDALWERALTS